jgi:shikimate dehydrogenase
MTIQLSGATRIYFIVGDPIAQAQSPKGVTASLNERGLNAVVVSVHVAPGDLDAFMAAAACTQNVDGVMVTVPHKFSAYKYCASASERSHFLNAVNAMRRNQDGSWHGDMLDGVGFVAALRKAGFEPKQRRALLIGAGGAGSAIAQALVEAGVSTLAIHDEDTQRRDTLVSNLSALSLAKIEQGSADASGFDLVVNATPMGMKVGDPLPVDTSGLRATAFVADVITVPSVPQLIANARELGCPTLTGTHMFKQVHDRMVDFYMEIQK